VEGAPPNGTREWLVLSLFAGPHRRSRALVEVRQGAERRKQKAEAKKAEAEAERKSAAQKVRSQQQKSQTTRSAVFAAAMRGESAKVKKGVWEEGVDAAGGEIKPGMDEFVQSKPKDPKQTLLHLAVMHGDAELSEWLDRHSACPFIAFCVYL